MSRLRVYSMSTICGICKVDVDAIGCRHYRHREKGIIVKDEQVRLPEEIVNVPSEDKAEETSIDQQDTDKPARAPNTEAPLDTSTEVDDVDYNEKPNDAK